MNTSKALRALATVALAAIGLIVLAVLLTNDHWWIRSRSVAITCSASMCAVTRVYQSRSGDILVNTDNYWYVIFPGDQSIGLANRSNFFDWPGFAYSKSAPPLVALMTPVKSITPDLIVADGRVEFNSVNEGRVRLTWSR